MVIEDIKAEPGDKVSVENYRCKPPVWESGTLIGAEYRYSSYTKSWAYRVRLSRESAAGNVIIVTVGQDKIEKAS